MACPIPQGSHNKDCKLYGTNLCFLCNVHRTEIILFSSEKMASSEGVCNLYKLKKTKTNSALYNVVVQCIFQMQWSNL